jgi:hypothetical protein
MLECGSIEESLGVRKSDHRRNRGQILNVLEMPVGIEDHVSGVQHVGNLLQPTSQAKSRCYVGASPL